MALFQHSSGLKIKAMGLEEEILGYLASSSFSSSSSSAAEAGGEEEEERRPASSASSGIEEEVKEEDEEGQRVDITEDRGLIDGVERAKQMLDQEIGPRLAQEEGEEKALRKMMER